MIEPSTIFSTGRTMMNGNKPLPGQSIIINGHAMLIKTITSDCLSYKVLQWYNNAVQRGLINIALYLEYYT